MLEFMAAMAATTQDATPDTPAVVLIRTRQFKLTPEQAKTLFKDSGSLVSVRWPTLLQIVRVAFLSTYVPYPDV